MNIGIIPARMASSRFPGKPLMPINGFPMVGHVYLRSKLSTLLDDVYVATCDQEIADFMHSIKGKVIMTSPLHARASDRAAEALLKIEEIIKTKTDIVVMIQGDEPMVTPEMIDSAIRSLLDDPSVLVSNVMSPVSSEIEHRDPNEVKVVVDVDSNALYFSREPIPSNTRRESNIPLLKQVCIIPYRRSFLLKFNAMEQTPLERAESVDMMRVLEHGYKVKMVMTKNETYSVDTVEDLREVEVLLKKDPYHGRYKKFIEEETCR